MSQIVGAQTTTLDYFLTSGGGGKWAGALMVALSWAAGRCGLPWAVPLLFAALAYAYWFRQTRRMRRAITWSLHSAMRDPAVARAVMGADLPSWVALSPIERCQWLQRLLDACWPFVSGPAEASVAHALAPLLERFRPKAILSRLELGYFDLGDVPPRIEGVRLSGIGGGMFAAESTVIDINLTWEGNPDVRVVATMGSAVVEPTLTNLKFRALVRLTLGPHCSEWPCFSGLSVSFVGRPRVEYSLRAARLPLDAIPGLAGWIEGFVAMMAGMLVYPRRLAFRIPTHKQQPRRGGADGGAASSSLSGGLSSGRTAAAEAEAEDGDEEGRGGGGGFSWIAEPVGCLFVEVLSAADLPRGGPAASSSSYVRVALSMGDGQQPTAFRTSTVRGAHPNFSVSDTLLGRRRALSDGLSDGGGSSFSSSSSFSSESSYSTSSVSSSHASDTEEQRAKKDKRRDKKERRREKWEEARHVKRQKKREATAAKRKKQSKKRAKLLEMERKKGGETDNGVRSGRGGRGEGEDDSRLRPLAAMMQFAVHCVPGEELTFEVVRPPSRPKRVMQHLLPPPMRWLLSAGGGPANTNSNSTAPSAGGGAGGGGGGAAAEVVIGCASLPVASLMASGEAPTGAAAVLVPPGDADIHAGSGGASGGGGSAVAPSRRGAEAARAGSLLYRTVYRAFAPDGLGLGLGGSSAALLVNRVGLVIAEIVGASGLLSGGSGGGVFVVVRVGGREARTESVRGSPCPSFGSAGAGASVLTLCVDGTALSPQAMVELSVFGERPFARPAALGGASVAVADLLRRPTFSDGPREHRLTLGGGSAARAANLGPDPEEGRRGTLTVGLKVKVFA